MRGGGGGIESLTASAGRALGMDDNNYAPIHHLNMDV
jgi:hypothetical protein